MNAMNDVRGQRFGLLTVVGRSDRHSEAGILWECRCDCGGSAVTTSTSLRNGHTASCGCLRKIAYTRTHGRSQEGGAYRSWKEMRQRCNNPRSDKFKWYAARGIKVCERWDSFVLFLSDMGERPSNKSLDRIDNDGNYEPGNCRWATQKEQVNNTRRSKKNAK